MFWDFLPKWTGWQCSLKMCPVCEYVLGFPAKLDWLTVPSENVFRLWVCPGISCQTGLADSALWKYVQCVSVFWDFLPNWLTVLSENVSRVWVCPGISCQTGLANSALWKCVQGVSVFWDFLPTWTGWQCSLKMCLACECVLGLPAKLDWLTVLSENVSRAWVCSGFACQIGLANSAFWKCVQAVSVFWHFLPNRTGWQFSLKMCPGCECVLVFPAKVDWLTVLSENVSSLWVCFGISYQTGLADTALWKCLQFVSVCWHFLPKGAGWQCYLKMCPGCECVLEFLCQTGPADSALWKCLQYVSVSWHFLPNWTGWQCSLTMCPGCECVLGLPAKLDWQCSVKMCQRLWVCFGISCQTGLADSALWKCVQAVSVFWHFVPDWTGWQSSLKMCPVCECDLALPAKLDWLTVLPENVSSMWVCSVIACQTGLADKFSLKMCPGCECVLGFPAKLDLLTGCLNMCPGCEFWNFLPNWTDWQCSLKMCPACECVVKFPAKLDWLTVLSENGSRVWVCFGISCQTGLADSPLSEMCPGCECVLGFSAKLDWLTVLSENVSSMWVCPEISCWTGLANSTLSKCV